MAGRRHEASRAQIEGIFKGVRGWRPITIGHPFSYADIWIRIYVQYV
jgi:hypothetical protein